MGSALFLCVLVWPIGFWFWVSIISIAKSTTTFSWCDVPYYQIPLNNRFFKQNKRIGKKTIGLFDQLVLQRKYGIYIWIYLNSFLRRKLCFSYILIKIQQINEIGKSNKFVF